MGIGLFGVLMDTLFIPSGPATPLIIVGVMVAVSLVLLVMAVVRKS